MVKYDTYCTVDSKNTFINVGEGSVRSRFSAVDLEAVAPARPDRPPVHSEESWQDKEVS